MELVSELLNGVKVIKPFVFEDERGNFVKPYHHHQLAALGIDFELREEFFSTSAAGVLRGMHFQVPPHAHQKLIYCISGSVTDVLLDLRVQSPSYGQAVSIELSERNRHVVYVPVGFAHGFYSLEDNSCLVYKTDEVHAPESDQGVLWNSFGFTWPKHGNETVISERDSKHVKLEDFNSPF
ncbi:MAG: dTDP-4-dehydrorhamnose 3,5-epimerase [Akkermansiaceae bacterium]|nr:dTDP-4-dehydrorhamnose 3,5-epimerase [Akkermansiaceae bacterium]